MYFDRLNAKRPRSKIMSFPAPVKGWIKNEALTRATDGGAEQLDNIFPTAQGARLRKGRSKQATIAAACKALFSYKSGNTEKLFAASATDIYDVTAPADVDVSPTASVSSLTNGDWTVAQFANSGGDYLVIANGADSVRNYNGTTWSTPTITGVTSSDLSHVWVFKDRQFFVEENTLSAWYLANSAISGAASEFPLRGVFTLGGSLLFGATWSLDSGEGLDDVCVFVTTEGEVAVYSGSDPASDFALQGVYRIGKPLNKNAYFKAGGDLAILTEDGIIPLSEALRKDRAALQAAAITFPIEDAWKDAITNRSSSFPFSVTLWHSQSMLMIGTPNAVAGTFASFVANARTGAWCRFTGWDVQCSAIYNDTLYFGQADATIWQAETTGSDQTAEYAGVWVPKFKEPSLNQKMAVQARFRGRASSMYNLGIACFADYETADGISVVAPSSEEASALWGTAVWGTDTWGGSLSRTAVTEWQGVSSIGTALSPAVRIPSNRGTAPNLEMISLDLMYQEGGVI
jgi:hypothetical protein